MKKLVLTIAVLAGVSYGAFAQGTISFNNFNPATIAGRVWTNSLSGAGLTGNTNGGALAPAGYTVELLAGPIGTGLASLTNAGIFTSTTAGGQFFDGATHTLGGVGAGSGSADVTLNAQLAIAGWVGGVFTDYASALAAAQSNPNIRVGIMQVSFGNPTGGGGTPAAPPAALVGWLASNPLVLAPVPEPSTLALGGLGIAALLMFRRKK